jgi:hypothetical protein
VESAFSCLQAANPFRILDLVSRPI